MPTESQIWFALFVAFLFAMSRFGLKFPKAKAKKKSKPNAVRQMEAGIKARAGKGFSAN